MPNTSSAKKALRGSLKKRDFNLSKKSKIKNSLKEFRRVVVSAPKEAGLALSKSFSALDKAVKTKLIKKNTADRKKSRLAKMLDKTLKAGE